MRYMPVPQFGHLPFMAFLLFFITTSFASFISFFALHFTQYAVVILPPSSRDSSLRINSNLLLTKIKDFRK